MSIRKLSLLPAIAVCLWLGPLFSTCVHAQTPLAPGTLQPEHECLTGEMWKVSGHVGDSTTYLPISRKRFVTIKGPVWCMILSDEQGNFEFSNLPRGLYSVTVGSVGYRNPPAVTVKVPSDTPIVVFFRMRPENTVVDCEELPDCKAILSGNPSALATLSESQRRAEAMFRTAIAFVGNGEWIACPMTSDTAVIAALRTEISTVRPPKECAMQSPGGSRALVFQTSTQTRGYFVNIDTMRSGVDSFEASLSYTAGARWGTDWRCIFTMKDGVWQPTSCKVTGMS